MVYCTMNEDYNIQGVQLGTVESITQYNNTASQLKNFLFEIAAFSRHLHG